MSWNEILLINQKLLASSDKPAPTDLESIWKHRSKNKSFLAKENIFILLIGMEEKTT